MVTILYRIAGKPSVEGLENPFRDVAEGRYYTDAVIWAAANGIVEGMEEGVFAPEGAVTRQQVAVILYRHSGAEAGNEDPGWQAPCLQGPGSDGRSRPRRGNLPHPWRLAEARRWSPG